MVFSSENLAPHGLTILSAVREPVEGKVERSLDGSAEALENDFYRVSVNADGTLDITDKQSGVEFRKCLHFVDEGDRGDSYTFDEVPGGEVVDAPAGPLEVTVVETGPVRATLKIDVCLHIPEKLVPERDARSSNRVATDISTLVSVYRDVKRIDFTTTFDNQCEDHRLRVVFNAPFVTPEIVTETVFGVVRRSSRTIPLDHCAEQPIGTGPQKTFSCIENGSVGVALFNRGIAEIEAAAGDAETALALTLVRSFGWLSREDLKARPDAAGPALETPGGQSKGQHVFEYAFASYRGTYAETGIAAQAHSYAYPPVAIVTNRHRGTIEEGTSLALVDNPNVVVSAVERSRLKQAWVVRLYNTAETAQSARLALWGKRATVYEVNLLEKRLSKNPLRRQDGRFALSFRPGEIKTLQVVLPK
jgi:alpha-mannosidase